MASGLSGVHSLSLKHYGPWSHRDIRKEVFHACDTVHWHEAGPTEYASHHVPPVLNAARLPCVVLPSVEFFRTDDGRFRLGKSMNSSEMDYGPLPDPRSRR